jgi:nucleosome assembly protein 1-like 1
MQYATKCSSLYDHRKRVIAGVESVTAREIGIGEEQSKKDDEDYKKLPSLQSRTLSPTPVREYWLRALQTHPGFSQLINDDDEAALRSLTDIRLTAPFQTSGSGFTFEFHFNRNAYFNNSVLRKTYIYKVGFGSITLIRLTYISLVPG